MIALEGDDSKQERLGLGALRVWRGAGREGGRGEGQIEDRPLSETCI